MKLIFSVFIAAFYGLAIRLLFDLFDSGISVMGISFFFLVPFIIGYITITLLRYKEGQSASIAFFKATLPFLVLFFITVYYNIEGSVCWLMALPPMAFSAGIGGVVAFSRKKKRYMRKIEFDFEKEDRKNPGGLKISLLFIVPLLAGAIEGERLSSTQYLTVKKELTVSASPDSVWNALVSSRRVTTVKQQGALSNFFGFPQHLYTTLDSAAPGGERIAAYEKGLTFKEIITDIEPGKHMVVAVTANASDISKAIMDEHIVIGGKHVQMQEDEYTLEPTPGGGTRVILSSKFSIHTPFNWYAGIWGRMLMKDILSEELQSLKPI